MKHGHPLLPPHRPGALYAIRNPWGNGKDNHIMNVMSSDTIIAPFMDIRIISPGTAAHFLTQEKPIKRIYYNNIVLLSMLFEW